HVRLRRRPRRGARRRDSLRHAGRRVVASRGVVLVRDDLGPLRHRRPGVVGPRSDRARGRPGRRPLRCPRGTRCRRDLSRLVDGAARRSGPRRHGSDLRRSLRAPSACSVAGPGTGVSWPVSDSAKVLTAQGVRAFAYGFGAVLLGTSLDDRHVPGWQVGLVLGAVVAGAALMSVLLARYADRLRRRRSYAGPYVLLGLVGVTFASSGPVWLLTVASLVGVLSTEVIESGPFTSLEQPMLAAVLPTPTQVHGFGLYNAVAAAAGSFGALAAALPGVLGGAHESRWFLLFVPVAVVGTVVARSLSPPVQPTGAAAGPAPRPASRSGVC